MMKLLALRQLHSDCDSAPASVRHFKTLDIDCDGVLTYLDLHPKGHGQHQAGHGADPTAPTDNSADAHLEGKEFSRAECRRGKEERTNFAGAAVGKETSDEMATENDRAMKAGKSREGLKISV